MAQRDEREIFDSRDFTAAGIEKNAKTAGEALSRIEAEKVAENNGNSLMKEILDWVLHIGAAVIIAFLIVRFVLQITDVIGTSMLPTLQEGDKLIMEKLTGRFGTYKRGDIIIIELEPESGKKKPVNSPLIKRIIGIEGDRIQIMQGNVYVNETKLSEGYIKGNYTEAERYPDYVVPKGHVFVMGDNRGASLDSRLLGSFKTSQIIGRAVFRVYPFNEFGGLSSP